MIKKFFKAAVKVFKEEGIKSFFSKAFSFIKRKAYLSLPTNLKVLFAYNVKNFKSKNIDKVIDYSFYGLGGVFRPMQIREEFKKFLQLYVEKSPKVILEIGTANGGSLFTLCKLAQDDATIISVDLPDTEFGGGYYKWKVLVYNLFKKGNQNLFLLHEDSHLPATVTKVKEILKGKEIDFLFIDGDHSYEGVKSDFEMFSPLVKKGGTVCFHDIAPNGLEWCAGKVSVFWKEIKNNYKHVEFVQDENQEGWGIGCLFL